MINKYYDKYLSRLSCEYNFKVELYLVDNSCSPSLKRGSSLYNKYHFIDTSFVQLYGYLYKDNKLSVISNSKEERMSLEEHMSLHFPLIDPKEGLSYE